MRCLHLTTGALLHNLGFIGVGTGLQQHGLCGFCWLFELLTTTKITSSLSRILSSCLFRWDIARFWYGFKCSGFCLQRQTIRYNVIYVALSKYAKTRQPDDMFVAGKLRNTNLCVMFLRGEHTASVGSEKIAQMLASLEEMLQRYDIDASVCGQRLFCSMVQNAAEKVAHGHGSSTDKLVDGLSG